MTGAEIVVKSLQLEGVQCIFAYPGGASMELHQALQGAGIRIVVPRHEQGGGFAADGFGRITGKPGVCLATSGPGATNLVTAIADAYADSVPMVAITVQVNQHLIGKNAFQETDIIGVTRPIVKHSYLVLKAEDIPEVMKDAFALASHGRPGPIVVDIASDVLQQSLEPFFPSTASLSAFNYVPELQVGFLEQVRQLLSRAKRPCIYAGGGIIHSDSSRELAEFAEKWHLPVTTSLMGKGAIADTHPCNLQMLGMHGNYTANRAVHECDLLLALGVRFSNRVTGDIEHFAPQATLIHVDIDASEINKNKPSHYSLVADLKEFLQGMLSLTVPRRVWKEWFAQLDAWKKQYPLTVPSCSSDEIRGPHFIQLLNTLTQGKATIVTGVGQHQMWTAQFYSFSRPRSLLTSGGLGAMGFGLPAAIGAALAKPDELVILVDGDGSFQMNIQELATVFAEKIPLKMIVLNNQLLGMVAQWEDYFYKGKRGNTDMSVPQAQRPYPDFVAIAKGYMIPAQEVYTLKEAESAVKQMLETPGPYLLDVHIRKHDAVMPMIPAGKTMEEIILR